MKKKKDLSKAEIKKFIKKIFDKNGKMLSKLAHE